MARQWQQGQKGAATGGEFRGHMDLRPIEMRNPELARAGRDAVAVESTRSLQRSAAPSHAGPDYRAYRVRNFRDLPQIQLLSPDEQFSIEVVAQVLPFKTNSYVVEELINWDDVPQDPIFVLNFPQREMLLPHHFEEVAGLLRSGADKSEIEQVANRIRLELNPHPAGQLNHNVPTLGDIRLTGMQHKYHQTVLFFPSDGQTCHAYCTFCFRWPQFVGMDELKFAMRETELLVEYVRAHPEVTDVLFTGGDPMTMCTRKLASYIDPLLEAHLPNLRTIRIGTKALSYWPYRFLTNDDAADVLDLFKRTTDAGIHLAFMAHFNHPRELSTDAVKEAIARIRETGAEIRTQSPLLRNINDRPEVWSEMWQQQVQLGCVPYYMFVARDTGAQHYFSVPLVRCWEIFQQAYQRVSGVARTVRGPSMSTDPGKVDVLGVTKAAGKKVIALRMLQGRNPDWAMRPFFADYDAKATWLTDLRPAFGEERFFFEEELERQHLPRKARCHRRNPNGRRATSASRRNGGR
jgi:KamA family protein